MNFKELLNKKKIEKIEIEEYDDTLAKKDLVCAKEVNNFDWALSIAYNAVLRSARSFMFHLGYRPIGREHHKNVFEFLRETGFNEELTNYFDNIRKKRNKFVYGIIESTSKENVKEVFQN